ncbi:MAG: O-succinylhomoserine sulfhydrylase [Rhodospirillales bacterium]|nr:O-succinylhomoserine sulfhydrylase [Rhodospirillales bacterium]
MADGITPAKGKTDPAAQWRPRTRMVRGGTQRTGFDETGEALFMTSGYVYGSAGEAEAAFAASDSARYVYSRYGNPTVAMFEERLRLIEGAEAAKATASGMAAVFAALMCQLKAGDRVVSSRALFGSCHYIVSELLPRYGVETVFVDGADPDQWWAALKPPTAAVFLETPSNPMLGIVDLRVVSTLAHAAGACVIVDNVFATPLLQKPLALGADVVVYSATKHIDGQGRCLGGAILGTAEFVSSKLAPFLRHTGPSLSPFNAWLLLKGLETLDLRVRAAGDSALALARFLEGDARVEKILYPTLESHPQRALAAAQMSGGGTIVSFALKGGKDAAFRFLDALALIDISNNLGDSKSLICHPATTTHQRVGAAERARLGIGDGVLRLSVGLEDAGDLEADLGRGLAAL